MKTVNIHEAKTQLSRLIDEAVKDKGYIAIPVTSEHAVAVDSLPPLHKDPFDRLLLAQAMVAGVALLTADPVLHRYPGPVRRV